MQYSEWLEYVSLSRIGTFLLVHANRIIMLKFTLSMDILYWVNSGLKFKYLVSPCR